MLLVFGVFCACYLCLLSLSLVGILPIDCSSLESPYWDLGKLVTFSSAAIIGGKCLTRYAKRFPYVEPDGQGG